MLLLKTKTLLISASAVAAAVSVSVGGWFLLKPKTSVEEVSKSETMKDSVTVQKWWNKRVKSSDSLEDLKQQFSGLFEFDKKAP